MNDMVMDILKWVIALLAMIVVRYFVPFIKAQIEASEYKWLTDLIDGAVKYAEQTIKGSGQGEAKYEEARKYIITQVNARGIDITEDQLKALIEAAVFGMKQGEVK